MKLQFSKQGLGCMSMSDFYGTTVDQEAGINLIKTAFKNGVNFFDTADMYACGENEKLVGAAVVELLNDHSNRDQCIIATKCGILRDKNDSTNRGLDNSYSYVKLACERSLENLGKAGDHIGVASEKKVIR